MTMKHRWSFPWWIKQCNIKRKFRCIVTSVAMLASAIFFFFSLVWSFLRKPRGISISRSVFLWAQWPSMTFGIFGMCKNRMDFLFIAANKQFSLKGIPSPHPIPKNNWLTHSGVYPAVCFHLKLFRLKVLTAHYVMGTHSNAKLQNNIDPYFHMEDFN